MCVFLQIHLFQNDFVILKHLQINQIQPCFEWSFLNKTFHVQENNPKGN